MRKIGFIMIVFLFLISCKKSNIDFIEVEYLPAYLSTQFPIHCKMVTVSDITGFDVKKKGIRKSKFLIEFEE